MKEYVRPETEIEFFEKCELVTTSEGENPDPVDCAIPGSLSYGEGEDPWG